MSWQPAFDHRRKVGRWWIGRRVRLTYPVITHSGIGYRKGRIARVTRKFGGLTLSGRKLFIRKVGYYYLEVEL